MPAEPETRDVVIIGGGLLGCMAAIMLARRGLDVLVLEARPAGQPQKSVVGEAITEGSSLFLRHEIGLDDWLGAHTFRKFGFDFLVLPRHERAPARPGIEDCHELLLSLTPLEKIGPALDRLIPTYHVDRNQLDPEVARRAEAEGVEIRRGASVKAVTIGESPRDEHEIRVGHEQTTESIRCKWVVDCTGRRSFLGRALGITERVDELPTAAIWNRFENVDADPNTWTTFDGIDRRRHTIHFSGPGFWIWWIHQNDGQTSVGVTYDKTQHQPDVKAEDRGFAEMIHKFPAVADALANANALDPYQYLAHLPYRSEHWVSEAGYSIIGDAGWFVDAVYSTAIETACRQLMAVVPLIARRCEGKALDQPAIDRLNEEFRFLQRSVLAHNKFKYREAWHRPHAFFQVALYELAEIAELYHLQERKRWRPEVYDQHYRLQWGCAKRLNDLEKFMAASLADGDRDLKSPRLLAKSLSPGRMIYMATWPLWRMPGLTPYFFVITRLWGYVERMAQRIAIWPDFLSLMAGRKRPRAVDGELEQSSHV